MTGSCCRIHWEQGLECHGLTIRARSSAEYLTLALDPQVSALIASTTMTGACKNYSRSKFFLRVIYAWPIQFAHLCYDLGFIYVVLVVVRLFQKLYTMVWLCFQSRYTFCSLKLFPDILLNIMCRYLGFILFLEAFDLMSLVCWLLGWWEFYPLDMIVMVFDGCTLFSIISQTLWSINCYALISENLMIWQPYLSCLRIRFFSNYVWPNEIIKFN